jgi:hypothetical protein
MKRSAVVVSLLTLALLLVPAAPGLARHRGFRTHVFIGAGPVFWWGPYWWHYPPPYYYPPPPVVVEPPPVYVQQEPPPPPPAPAPQAYWYYCSSAGAYYPSVSTCPEAWVKVPPRP